MQTRAYVSVGQIRQIAVRVVGEVANPGVYPVTGLSTVLDVLSLAGGVKKSGSLRNVVLVNNGKARKIDLYALLLTRGSNPDMTIAQDDRIVVPPIGATVAVAGDVRRPGIYELPSGADSITARALSDLGNGPQLRGSYRHMIMRIGQKGEDQLVNAADNSTAVREGEVLFVRKAVSITLGRIEVAGAVRLPGEFPLDKYKSLHDLFPSIDVLAPASFLLFGVIERTDAKTLQRSLVPFSLIHVIQGRENQRLVSGDTVHVFTLKQIHALAAVAERGRSKQLIFAAPVDQAGEKTVTEPERTAEKEKEEGTEPDFLSPEDVAFFGNLLADYRVRIQGAVNDPGVLLVSHGTTLDEVVASVGGLTRDADTGRFEITSTMIDNQSGRVSTVQKQYETRPELFATVPVGPLDNIIIRHSFSDRIGGDVEVAGEVLYPGHYPIVRGERLSQVLARAGGMTSVAYPYGAVFQRESLKNTERLGSERLADELQLQLATHAGQASDSSARAQTMQSLGTIEAFITALRRKTPVGRMVVAADRETLAAHPEKDPLLQAGDRIYIPQRPDSVTLLGGVKQPGHYMFEKDATASDYIEQAGGITSDAQDDMSFIIYPDGRARSLEQSWYNFGDWKVPPGSTIYVPTQLFPKDWLPLSTSILAILKDLAVSAASVAVLSR